MDEAMNLDPIGNYKPHFEKTIYIPIKFKGEDTQESTSITFKLKQDRDEAKLIIFLLSETDIFFLYRIDISTKTLIDINNKYKLKCQTTQHFIDFFRKSLLDCEDKTTSIQIFILDEANLKLKIFKEWNGKNFTIIEMNAKREKSQMVKMMAAYRYGLMREEIAGKEHRISKLKQLIKLRNPYLITFINKL